MIDNICRTCSHQVAADALGVLVDASGSDVCGVSGDNEPHVIVEVGARNVDIDGIEWLITPELVEWRRDNGGTVFEHEKALGLMFVNDVVFLNGLCHISEPSSDGIRKEVFGMVSVHVNCNDVFAWGCADAEDLPYSEIENLYRFWRKDPDWGAAIWCRIRRNQMPQKPVEDKIATQGIWNLADFNLSPNTMDAEMHEFLRTVVAQVNAAKTADDQIALIAPPSADSC